MISCMIVQYHADSCMLTRQRKRWILERLRAEGQILAAEASRELGISADTVRRDLRELAAEGVLQRVHGGALPASPAVGDLAARRQVEIRGKRAIAAAAAARVRRGQLLFVDGGTTCEELVRKLPRDLQATVVTHSPTVAAALVEHERIEVVLIGGRLFKHSMVTVGTAAAEAISRIRADVYFMGVTGVRAREGLSTGDLEEADVKRTLIAHAAETWVLASTEKLDAASAYRIAPCRDVTGLIVERSVPVQRTRPFERLGLQIVRA
jgi:DeoR/GlpR family transcriptional regulator of sugar metabolism